MSEKNDAKFGEPFTFTLTEEGHFASDENDDALIAYTVSDRDGFTVMEMRESSMSVPLHQIAERFVIEHNAMKGVADPEELMKAVGDYCEAQAGLTVLDLRFPDYDPREYNGFKSRVSDALSRIRAAMGGE